MAIPVAYPPARAELLRTFRLVDFAARRQPGFRNRLVPVEEVAGLVRRYGAHGCYATFYLYDEAIRVHAQGAGAPGKPSVAGYDGPVYAPVWPLDIDAPDLGEALAAARAVVERLGRVWGVPREAVRRYFSGKKGFHVTVDTRVFLAPVPSRLAPELLHRLTRRLARELGFPPSGPLDLSLRDRVRLLRLPNTRHEESGLFKVPLSAEELGSLGPEAIREAARAPRPLAGVDPSGLLLEACLDLVPRARAILEEVAAPSGDAVPRGRPPSSATAAGGTREVLECPARQALLSAPAPPGQRNNTAIRLASWLREAGWDEEAVGERLGAWNGNNPTPLADEEVRHVVRSAFASPEPYRYGCRDPLIAPLCPPSPAQRARCPYHPRNAGAQG
ncbi:MAG: primase C-terminal domain-containing protein [Thermodesulfobacteriota bacterium]